MIFIAFDIETTGRVPGVDHIAEIGAVRFEGGEPVAVFSTLIDPGIPMPAGASAVNGITDEMLVGKPKIEDLLESLSEFCGDTPLVAHNAPFDTQFLLADYKKHELPTPRGVILDTLTMSRKVLPGLANYKLGTIVDHLKISSNSDFHRAEEDATYCGRVFQHLLQRIDRTGQNIRLEQLVTLSAAKEVRFPFIEKRPKQLSFLI